MIHVDAIFKTCARYDSFLSAVKREIYNKTVNCCKHIPDDEGSQQEPYIIEAIETMNTPVTMVEWGLFIYNCRRMCTRIPGMHIMM